MEPLDENELIRARRTVAESRFMRHRWEHGVLIVSIAFVVLSLIAIFAYFG